MKTKTIINLMLFFVLIMFNSCDNELYDGMEDQNRSHDFDVEVFTVTPNGIDDTQNIKDAFTNAKLAGEGSIVQLMAGTFYISEPIIITDFEGDFKGAGKGLTVLEDLPNSIFPLVNSGPLVGQRGLLIFYLENKDIGNLNISDMTIHLKGIVEESVWHQSQTVLNSNIGITVLGKVNGVEDFEISEVNVTVNNIDFIGEESSNYLPNRFNHDIGLLISGEWLLEHTPQTILFKTVQPISGNINVTNCLFKNNRLALDIPGTKNAEILIGGLPNNQNVFDNVLGAITFFDMSGGQIELSHNRGQNIRWWGIWAEQGYDAYLTTDGFGPYLSELGIPEPAHILVEHNDLSIDNWGIIISDVTNAFGDGKSLNAVVSHNKLTMTNPWSGGIFGWDSDDVFVSNNKFYGQGDAGIYFGLWGGPGHDNWTMIGNNFNSFNAGVGSIWLGPDANNCTVVGGNNSTNCMNEGSNNTMTGVSNQGNPPGPEIAAAINERRDLIKSLRN